MIARVIIAGSRTFNNYDLLKKQMDYWLSGLIQREFEIEIVSGTARGADRLGERYAEEEGYPVEPFPAKWRVNGIFNPRAGHERNEQMAVYADYLCLFWDGKSRGSANMLKNAKKHGLKIREQRFTFEAGPHTTHGEIDNRVVDPRPTTNIE